MDNFQNIQSHYYKKYQYKIKDALLQRKKYEKRTNQIQIQRSKMENRKFGKEIKDLNNLTEISNQTNAQISKIGEILSKINKDPDKYFYKDNINLEYKIPSINKIIKNPKISNIIKVNMNKKPTINTNVNNNNYYKNSRHSSITSKHNKYISFLQDKNNFNTLRDISSRSKSNKRKIYRNSVVLKKIRKNSIIQSNNSRNNISFSNYNHINNEKINKINIIKFKVNGKENDFNSINLANNNTLKNYNYVKYNKRSTNNENNDTLNNNKFSNSKNKNRESHIMRFIRKQYNLPKERVSNKILNLSLNYRHKSKKKDKEIDNNDFQRKSHVNIPKRSDNIGLIPLNKKGPERYSYNQNNIFIVFPRNINPQIPNEYINDIYSYLKSIEHEDLPLKNYMDIIQNDINEKMRMILIDWLIEVHLRFHLKEQTLYITIGIIDIYLSSKIIQRSKLQLLGITALLIACKSQEIYYPPIKDFIDITDKAYEKKELIQMEYYVLSILNFKILFPTACDFYDIISQIYHFNSQQYYLGKYFMECALIDYRMTKYHSSILACSCGYLVMKYFGIKNYKMMYEPLMSNEIAPQKIVKQCGKEICILIRGLKKTSLKATRDKYSLNEFEKVSELCDVEN